MVIVEILQKAYDRNDPTVKVDCDMQDRFEKQLSRRDLIVGGVGLGTIFVNPQIVRAIAQDTGPQFDLQPYFSHVRRLVRAMQLTGEPFQLEHEKTLLALVQAPSDDGARAAEEILNLYTLARVRLDKDGNGLTLPGLARRELVEQGWRCFLVRIENPYAQQCALDFSTGFDGAQNDSGVISLEGSVIARTSSENVPSTVGRGYQRAVVDLSKGWIGYNFAGEPLSAALIGLPVEYRILQLFSRDRGSRSALLSIHGKQSAPLVRRGAPLAKALTMTDSKMQIDGVGFRATFNCLPSNDLILDIRDYDGGGCTASVLVKDEIGRLYPAPAHRLAPDFSFQPQVYRASGETVRLPDGRYTIEAWRGPEYVRKSHLVTMTSMVKFPRINIQLERWIDAAALGWYPGDTHIHAAGCSHYESPTVGVTPETMLRHVRGEALAVGDILTWGPGYDYQKQFNTAHVYTPLGALEFPELQLVNNTSLTPKATTHDGDSTVRYDVEVSGFPSSPSGHLVLLQMIEFNYPGAATIADWPTWNLPILIWAKAQGCVTGYGHCGSGMVVDSIDLPNYEIPPFDSVGANEYIVDVAHGVVDFMSGTQMSPVAELNCWYHTLNCGFRSTMVGETDFPCFFDERVGHGRTYVGLPQRPTGDAGYAMWIEGIRRGRLYFGDGRSHFIDFRVNDRPVGGADVRLGKPGKVRVTVELAARLESTESTATELSPWHIEHGRLGHSRNVVAEIVVNGRTVSAQTIAADGEVRRVSVWIDIEQSSWVALRILPSGHTHPIFVQVASKTVRASRRSAQWCLECVDALWREKWPTFASADKQDAAAAYERARRIYRQVLSDAGAD